MEVNSDSQGGARHRHQGVRFVCRVQRNSSDSLVDGVKQEGAHTCSETGQYVVCLFGHQAFLLYV